MRKTFLKLISALAVFGVLACTLVGTLTPAPVKAESSASERVEQSIDGIETALSEKNTDVISELERQHARYQALYETAQTEEERNQISMLIIATEGMLSDYTGYVNGVTPVGRGIEHAVYTPAISAIVAYFSANNYNLSAELLSYARINNELNSFYHPVNGKEVLSSPVFKEICKNGQLSGSGQFPKEGRVNDMDLFYSLHNFYYAKFDGGRLVVINDRYDFAYNAGFEGLDNISVNLAYEAQEAGVLVPFYNIIDMKVEADAVSLTGGYDRITRDEYGVFHVFDDACDGACNVWNCTLTRTVEDHADLDEDGKCDYCNALQSNYVPPEEPKSPATDASDGKAEKDFGETVGDFFGEAKNYATNLLSGCSGVLTAPIGGITAFVFGIIALFRKKK